MAGNVTKIIGPPTFAVAGADKPNKNKKVRNVGVWTYPVSVDS